MLDVLWRQIKIKDRVLNDWVCQGDMRILDWSGPSEKALFET